MNTVTIFTNGDSIRKEYARVRPHPEINDDIAVMELVSGGMEINFHFETGEEMIEFCEKHNFSYEDLRESSSNEQIPGVVS
jgi:GH35 family endo-1,4-beta-xylanase